MDIVVVDGLPCSDISAVWHVPIIPVVDVLHSLALTDACLASLDAAVPKRDGGGPLHGEGALRRLVLVDWVAFSYSTEVLLGTVMRKLDTHESLRFSPMAAWWIALGAWTEVPSSSRPTLWGRSCLH